MLDKPSAQLAADLVLGVDRSSLLGAFNRAGVLAAADVHVARTLSRLAGGDEPLAELAVAFAVRAPRVGHVLADLSNVRSTAVAGADAAGNEGQLDDLPWPDVAQWLESVARSPLVGQPVGQPGEAGRPLVLEGSALYLERYWRDESAVARELLRRAGAPAELGEAGGAPSPGAEVILRQLFDDDPSGLQARAAKTSARRLLSVVAGGPGTGKTTTIARFLALLHNRAGDGPPSVALTAPTGKAAARVAEAVHQEALRLPLDQTVRAWLASLEASTVHRLLGRHPASANRFRHDSNNRLPHDVVVVDETSMMSLPLMAGLLEAVRPDAHLVLVGDPAQLASVEAGAVLADIVGPAGAGDACPPAGAGDACPPVGRPGSELLPGPRPAGVPTGGALRARPRSMADCVTVLRVNHRFGGPLAELAEAARAGDEDAVVKALRGGGDTVRWLDVGLTSAAADDLAPVRRWAVETGKVLAERSGRGDPVGALEALGKFRILCAHRDGPSGASTWNARVEQWLSSAGVISQPVTRWYPGRAVVVTENDYVLELWNGDTGVAVARSGGGVEVAFARGRQVKRVSPLRLDATQTAFAMTAHRAQGSEFDDVVFLMPASPARILTRELFYTAVTRARCTVTVVGDEEAVRAAMRRPVARSSGLAARLWGSAL